MSLSRCLQVPSFIIHASICGRRIRVPSAPLSPFKREFFGMRPFSIEAGQNSRQNGRFEGTIQLQRQNEFGEFAQSKHRSRGPVMAAAKRKGEGGGAKEESNEGGIYRETVNLPVTEFSLRANSTTKEPALQSFWEEHQILRRVAERNEGDPFTLHDGPPYANGDLHIGHALNKILKDFINRYQLLRGRKVSYVPGWDCHGLPIELKVLQSLSAEERKGLSAVQLRKKAREFALSTVDNQREAFKRYGVWAEWDHPYLTLSPVFEAFQLSVFARMFLNGFIFRGKKPVHWSPSSQTALAEAELEYPEGHTSRSIYAAFSLSLLSPSLRECVRGEEEAERVLFGRGGEGGEEVALAIWTTTPWTIPGNAAVAVNGSLDYSLVEISPPKQGEEGGEGENADGEGAASPSPPSFGKGKRNEGKGLSEWKYLIVASALLPSLSAKWGKELREVASFEGRELEGCSYVHPLSLSPCPVVLGGDYITTESGTGLVHTAPGHGQEDFATGQKYSLPVLSPVDALGRFTKEAGEDLEGQSVLKEGNVSVMEKMEERGSLLLEEEYAHKYPYDWRTKKPTIFRCTEQWFASVQGFRDKALQEIKKVQWIPAQGENRITAMTESRSDWCISRQRSWGVPIPAFYQRESKKVLMDEHTLKHVQALVAEFGSDVWFERDVSFLLPDCYKHLADEYEKGTDTMDVWFDSGSSWAGVLHGFMGREIGEREGEAKASDREESKEKKDRELFLRFPASLYLEGSDQHRGWFQSSLLTSVAATGMAPYERVLTHGFVLDERGFKMSKSLGNVVDPRKVIEGGKNQKSEPAFGSDTLRLWVSSVDYTSDVMIGGNVLKQMADVYRKVRGTIRFMIGNIHDFEATKHSVPYVELSEVDRFALWRLSRTIQGATESFEAFQFYRFFQLIQRYVVVDLSNFYFDVLKDRLYVGGTDSFTRRSAQTVLHSLLLSLLPSLSPILPHLAEDAFQSLAHCNRRLAHDKGGEERADEKILSVFECGWPETQAEWDIGFSPTSAALWTALLNLRGSANKALELARTSKLIGSNLDAKVILSLSTTSGSEESSRSSLLLSFLSHLRSYSSYVVNAQGERVREERERAGEFSDESDEKCSVHGQRQGIDSLRALFLTSQVVWVDGPCAEAASVLHVQHSLIVDLASLLAASEEAEGENGAAAGSGEEQEKRHSISPSSSSNGASLADAGDSPPTQLSLWIGVARADGEKCERCWNFSPLVGSFTAHPSLCERCHSVIEKSGFVPSNNANDQNSEMVESVTASS